MSADKTEAVAPEKQSSVSRKGSLETRGVMSQPLSREKFVKCESKGNIP